MTRRRGTTIAGFISERGRRRSVAPGEPLFHEGDRSHSVFVCLDGRIRIFVTMPSGRDLILGIKSVGQEFGELSAIDGRPRSASAAALDRSTVAYMPGVRFVDELVHEPALAAALLSSLADQLRRANARLSARNAESATVRTGHMLLELSGLVVRHGPPGEPISLAITQADLADWVGTTRESTARALAGFRAAGVVDTKRGSIVVRDVNGLEELVRTS